MVNLIDLMNTTIEYLSKNPGVEADYIKLQYELWLGLKVESHPLCTEVSTMIDTVYRQKDMVKRREYAVDANRGISRIQKLISTDAALSEDAKSKHLKSIQTMQAEMNKDVLGITT